MRPDRSALRVGRAELQSPSFPSAAQLATGQRSRAARPVGESYRSGVGRCEAACIRAVARRVHPRWRQNLAMSAAVSMCFEDINGARPKADIQSPLTRRLACQYVFAAAETIRDVRGRGVYTSSLFHLARPRRCAGPAV